MKKLLTILVAVLAVSLAPLNAEAASVKKPVASTGSGTYYKSVTVKLKKKSGYKYYYTTNRKNPTNKSKKFGSKLTIKKNTELRVVAYKGKKKSSVAKYNYKIQKSYAVPNKAAGKYFSSQKVKFTLAKGYTYKYSTNGKKFNKLTSKTKVGISGTKTITVKVYKGKKVKKTLKFKYEVKKPTVKTNASSGHYEKPVTVKFETKENYTVKYSVDGGSWITLPSSGELTIKKSGSYKFRIYDKGGNYKEEIYSYDIGGGSVETPSTGDESETQPSTPSVPENKPSSTVNTNKCSVTASVAPGTYNEPITVKFSCSKGHNLWYSINGSDYDDVTTAGVTINKSCTVYIVHPDNDDADEVKFTYVIKNNNSNSGSTNTGSSSKPNLNVESDTLIPDIDEIPDGYNTTKYETMNDLPVLNRYNCYEIDGPFNYIDKAEFKYIYENLDVNSKGTPLSEVDGAIRDAGIPIAVNSNGVITNLKQFSDLEKITKMYKWMATHFTKVNGATDDYDKPFYGYVGNCAELSGWFGIFMERLQVPATTVGVGSINHAWNIILYEGAKYNIDITVAVTGSTNNRINWLACLVPDHDNDYLLDKFSCTTTDHIMGAEEVISCSSLEEVKSRLSEFQAYKAQGRRIAVKVPMSVSTVDLGRALQSVRVGKGIIDYASYQYIIVGV